MLEITILDFDSLFQYTWYLIIQTGCKEKADHPLHLG